MDETPDVAVALLIEMSNGGHRQVFYEAFLAGRNVHAALYLEDFYASPRHARFYPGDDGWYVEDLGSLNGTYLDGLRIQGPRLLGKGARLRVGHTVMTAVPASAETVWTVTPL
jgi:pSer/pThr/pTyr-binding forkhead associated (FHA) protein